MSFLKKFIGKKNNSYAQISYSQSGEDLIINYIFTQLHIYNPTYIDIGAHHPFYLSNTALFYENGSRGINIEPDPTLFKAFLQSRKQDININIGIGSKKELIDFYLISSPALNTFSKEEAERYKQEGDYTITKIIPTFIDSINNVLNEYNSGKFPQFLNIDAEGVDQLIIESIDFNKVYPIVICVETISFSMSRKGIKNEFLIELILKNGYVLYADTYLNSIFVRKDIW